MIYYLIGLLILIILFCFIGYKYDKKIQPKYEDKTITSNSQFVIHRISGRMFVLIDKGTHVQYLHVHRNIALGNSGGNALTPLYKADGGVCVGESITPNRFSFNELDDLMGIITDNENHVRYLQVYTNKLYDGGIALLPLLNADGGLITK